MPCPESEDVGVRQDDLQRIATNYMLDDWPYAKLQLLQNNWLPDPTIALHREQQQHEAAMMANRILSHGIRLYRAPGFPLPPLTYRRQSWS